MIFQPILNLLSNHTNILIKYFDKVKLIKNKIGNVAKTQ